MRYTLSVHAREQMQARDLPLDVIEDIINTPEQILEGEAGRRIYQSRLNMIFYPPNGSPGRLKMFLIRLVVADNQDPAVIVTVYQTTKIDKYWRPE